MCLTKVFKNLKIKDKIGKEGLKVYKVVVVRSGKYYPPYKNTRKSYAEGINKAEMSAIDFPVFLYGEKASAEGIKNRVIWGSGGKYQAGFHFLLSKRKAQTLFKRMSSFYNEFKFEMIECIVKKEWITTVGTEEVYKIYDNKVYATIIVAKKAIFPKPVEVK